MKYLVDSQKTLDNLPEKDPPWQIVHFFFDFRAGFETANRPEGMLRMFLRQTTERFPETLQKLSETRHAESINKLALPELMDLFCSLTRPFAKSMCAFIDGLDEFEGNLADLLNCLELLQDRTGMKMCLASRPEPQIQNILVSVPDLKMQDYNQNSIRIYIERSVERAKTDSFDVDLLIDSDLQNRVRERSEGVILWARFAIDEMIACCLDGTSKEDIENLLDSLPPELEQIYERILNKIAPSNRQEAALLLLMIMDSDGSLALAILLGAWHFLFEKRLNRTSGVDVDDRSFKARLCGLIGSLIDISLSRDLSLKDPELEEEIEVVRPIHKTLQSYLRHSNWIASNLASCDSRYLETSWVQVLSEVLIQASEEQVLPLKNLLASGMIQKSGDSYYHEPPDRKLTNKERARSLRSLIECERWQHRAELLNSAPRLLCSYAVAYEKQGHSSYQLLRKALESDLMITSKIRAVCLLHEAIPCDTDILRVARALCYDLKLFVLDWLSEKVSFPIGFHQKFFDFALRFLFRHRELGRGWSEVLEYLIEGGAQFGPNNFHDFLSFGFIWALNSEDKFENHLSNLSALYDLRPQSWLDDHALTCLSECGFCTKQNSCLLVHWTGITKFQAYDITSPRPYSDNPNQCEKSLKFIMEKGFDINERCCSKGTVLHLLVGQPNLAADNLYRQRLPKFRALAMAGIDPTIPGPEGDAIKVAQKTSRRLFWAAHASILRGDRKYVTVWTEWRDQRDIVKHLQYYVGNGHWHGDLFSPRLFYLDTTFPTNRWDRFTQRLARRPIQRVLFPRWDIEVSVYLKNWKKGKIISVTRD